MEKIPDLMLIYGPDGVGKTTFASMAPKPFFIDLERGSRRIIKPENRDDKIKTYADVIRRLNKLYTDPHSYETVVIDSLSVLETLIWEQVCLDEGTANIEQVGGGFSKGYIIALKTWQQFKTGIMNLQDKRGMNVILIGHAVIKTFTDPQSNAPYDRYLLKLHEKASALIREWVDFVGFANFVTHTKGKENALKHKAFGDGSTKLYTARRPGFDAKSRIAGMPADIPFSYAAYSAIANADPGLELRQLLEDIETLIQDSTDEAFKKTVRDFTATKKENAADLIAIRDRLRTKIEEETASAGTIEQ